MVGVGEVARLGSECIRVEVRVECRLDLVLWHSFRHQPQEPLTIPVTAFGGDADPRTGVAELRAWGELTRGRFETYTYPGGHFYLQRHAAGMLAVISSSMIAC